MHALIFTVINFHSITEPIFGLGILDLCYLKIKITLELIEVSTSIRFLKDNISKVFIPIEIENHSL